MSVQNNMKIYVCGKFLFISMFLITLNLFCSPICHLDPTNLIICQDIFVNESLSVLCSYMYSFQFENLCQDIF